MAVIDHAVSSLSEDSSPDFNHHDHHGSQGCRGRRYLTPLAAVGAKRIDPWRGEVI